MEYLKCLLCKTEDLQEEQRKTFTEKWGEIDDDMVVFSACKTNECCNPFHLTILSTEDYRKILSKNKSMLNSNKSPLLSVLDGTGKNKTKHYLIKNTLTESNRRPGVLAEITRDLNVPLVNVYILYMDMIKKGEIKP